MADRQASGESGVALADLLIATVIVLSVSTLAVPLTASLIDRHEAHAAASYLGGRIAETRLGAVAGNQATALVFDDEDDRGWSVRRCRDGNGNGVRRADIDAGRDPCGGGQRLGRLLGGVTLGLDPGVPGIDEPAGRVDGVRFGRSGMASCSPAGHCTPGTLYLRSPGGGQFAVRVAGVTGRTRVLQFNPGSGRWETP